MLEILSDTDKRLVMALGERTSGRTRIILDKGAGRAWFERQRRFRPQRTLDLALADISSIDTETVTRGETAFDFIVIATTARRRHRIAGEGGSTQDAAARLRAFAGIEASVTPHVTRAASPIAYWGRRAIAGTALLVVAAGALALTVSLGSVVIGAAGKAASAVLGAAGRVGGWFALPACDATASRNTIQELVRDRLGPSATLGDIADDGRAGSERLCRAIARRDGRIAGVRYRNYWDGWTPKVRLTGEIITAKLDPARTAAIARAIETFTAASRNSHRDGSPPRQTDPMIDQSLATTFGASDLAAEPLAVDEIDRALQWLKAADRIGAAYLLAGTGFDDFATVPQTAAVQQRMRGNVVAFAGEFGRYADFQMVMLGAIAGAQMRAAQGTGAGAGGARTEEIRALLSQALKSGFIALVYDGHDDAWRMGRLTALGRAAPVAAKFLTRDDARAVREQALQTVEYFKDAAVRAKVRDIADQLSAP